MSSTLKSMLVLIPYEIRIVHKSIDKCLVYHFKKDDFDGQGNLKSRILVDIVRKIQLELKEPQEFLVKPLNIRDFLYILEGNGGTDSTESTTNLEVTCFLDLHPASSTYDEFSEVGREDYFQSHIDASKHGTWEIAKASTALDDLDMAEVPIPIGRSCAMFTERAFKALKKAILLQSEMV